MLQDLQVKKLQNEVDLQEIEKKIKERDSRRAKLFNPTFVTILVAVLGLIGAAITGFQQRRNQLDIEEKKFQYSIYQRAMEAKDQVTAAQILDFYIKAGLLPGEPGKYSKLLKEGKGDQIPLFSGIYEGLVVPEVDQTANFYLDKEFVRGKGTEYMISYNASEGLTRDSLATIVLHCAFSNSLKSTANFLADTVTGNASAHLLIDRDGKVIQQVPFNYRSHHARQYNRSSIGIEFINAGSLKKTDDGYVTALGQKIDGSKVACNSEGLCWEKYTDAQLQAGYEICALLAKQYNIRRIVGHSEIESRKTDPGPFFPIEKFKALVQQSNDQ